MTKEEALIYAILETFHGNADAFACAVKETERLLFLEEKSIDDILISKDIYPVAAQKTCRSLGATAKQIERISNLCWDRLNESSRLEYIGKNLNDIHAPSDMLFYLAYYCHYGVPFYHLCKHSPEIFEETTSIKAN